jgi:hypothetical protein
LIIAPLRGEFLAGGKYSGWKSREVEKQGVEKAGS